MESFVSCVSKLIKPTEEVWDSLIYSHSVRSTGDREPGLAFAVYLQIYSVRIELNLWDTWSVSTELSYLLGGGRYTSKLVSEMNMKNKGSEMAR